MYIEKDGRSTHCYCGNPRARWALEITIIEIQWDLRPVIWEFFLMTLIIGDKRLACSFQYNTLFLRMMIFTSMTIDFVVFLLILKGFGYLSFLRDSLEGNTKVIISNSHQEENISTLVF